MKPDRDNFSAGHIDLDHSKIYSESLGTGPPLTMSHDGLIDCRIWDGQFRHFSDQFRVARYDRRGYGRSTPPQADYSNVNDLHALLDYLDIDRTVLMGCSSGGRLALDFALAYPDRVTALILVGPAVSGFEFSEHMIKRLDTAFRPLLEEEDVEQTIENWATDPNLIHPDNQAAQDRFRELLLGSPHNFYDSAGHTAVESVPPAIGRLGEVQAPTLILIGEADGPDNHAASGALQVGIHGSKRFVISGAAHLPNLEQPEIFNGLISDFLADQGVN